MLRAKPDLMPDIAPSLRSRIRICGHTMRPLAAGALYWEGEDTLLVAALHLEKGAAYAASVRALSRGTSTTPEPDLGGPTTRFGGSR